MDLASATGGPPGGPMGGGGGDPLAGLMGGAKMPGSMAGGPPGPGASPMTTPAAGAGNEAAADGMIKSVIPALHKSLSAYPIGSKKYTSVLNAIRALTANFGKESQQPLVPSAILQMAQAAKTGSPMSPSPPPMVSPAQPTEPPPGGPPMPGM